MANLWNIGDHENPVIQGQAGKPFKHEKGPTLKFENQEQPVDNSCLCKYPYQRYYWIYAKVDEDTKNINFFTQDFPYTASDSIDYTIEGKQGWEWELCSRYQSAGCHSKTATGKWQPVSIFPYSQQCSDAQQPIEYNLTFPSPKYIGIQDKNASITLNQSSIPTPFRTNTGAPSLMRMLVSSYKCCNGETGCGKVTQPKNTWVDVPGGHFCSQWFIATWDCEEADPVLYTALSRASQGECTQGGYYEDETIPLTCNTAKIRRHRERLVLADMELQDCRQCLQNLYTDISGNQKPPPVDGRRYRLYKYPVEVSIQTYEGQYYAQRVCKWGTPYKVQNETWNSVPPEIRGAGQGCLPYGAHDTRPKIVCSQGSYGVEAWQWAQSQNCYTEPEAPSTLTGDTVTGQECNCIELQIQSFFSDSAVLSDSRDSKDPPCNIPDPPPYKYRDLDLSWDIPQFQHTKFDVYRVRLYANGKDSPQDDACISYLEPDRNVDGSLRWNMVLMQNYDYEIFQKGYLSKIQNRFSREGEQGAYTYWYYTVVRSDCDPEVDQKDLSQGWAGMLKSPWESQCPVYFAVYWNPQEDCTVDSQGNRVVVRPHGRGCTVWERLGALSDEALSANYIFPDIWTPYKFSQDPQVWGYRYVVKTQAGTKSYCQEVPQLPTYGDYKQLVWQVSSWTPDCDAFQQDPTQELKAIPPISYVPQVIEAQGGPFNLGLCQLQQNQVYVPCRVAGQGTLVDNEVPSCAQQTLDTFPALKSSYMTQQDTFYAIDLDKNPPVFVPLKPQSGTYDIVVDKGLCQVVYIDHIQNVLAGSGDFYFPHDSMVPVVWSQEPISDSASVSYMGVSYKAQRVYGRSAWDIEQTLQDFNIKFDKDCCNQTYYYAIAWRCQSRSLRQPNSNQAEVRQQPDKYYYYTPLRPPTSSDSAGCMWPLLSLGAMTDQEFAQKYFKSQTFLPYHSSGLPNGHPFRSFLGGSTAGIWVYIFESQKKPSEFCPQDASIDDLQNSIPKGCSPLMWYATIREVQCQNGQQSVKSIQNFNIQRSTEMDDTSVLSCDLFTITKESTLAQPYYNGYANVLYLPFDENGIQFRYTASQTPDEAIDCTETACYLPVDSCPAQAPMFYCQAIWSFYYPGISAGYYHLVDDWFWTGQAVTLSGGIMQPRLIHLTGTGQPPTNPSASMQNYNGVQYPVTTLPKVMDITNIASPQACDITFNNSCVDRSVTIFYSKASPSDSRCIAVCDMKKAYTVQVFLPAYDQGQEAPQSGIYYDQDGEIIGIPSTGWHTSYSLSDSFGGTVEVVNNVPVPSTCGQIYYIYPIVHCTDTQPETPQCPFNSVGIDWSRACGKKMRVMTVGPFTPQSLQYVYTGWTEWRGTYPCGGIKDGITYSLSQISKQDMRQMATFKTYFYGAGQTDPPCPYQTWQYYRETAGGRYAVTYGPLQQGLHTQAAYRVGYHDDSHYVHEENWLAAYICGQYREAYIQWAACYQVCQDIKSDSQIFNAVFLGYPSSSGNFRIMGFRNSVICTRSFCSLLTRSPSIDSKNVSGSVCYAYGDYYWESMHYPNHPDWDYQGVMMSQQGSNYMTYGTQASTYNASSNWAVCYIGMDPDQCASSYDSWDGQSTPSCGNVEQLYSCGQYYPKRVTVYIGFQPESGDKLYGCCKGNSVLGQLSMINITSNTYWGPQISGAATFSQDTNYVYATVNLSSFNGTYTVIDRDETNTSQGGEGQYVYTYTSRYISKGILQVNLSGTVKVKWAKS